MPKYSESEFSELIGKKIKQSRTDLGISIEEIEKNTGINQEFLHGIEDGSISLNLNEFVRIANFLKVDPEDLVEFTK